jgi:putative flippase GtrA
MKGSSMLYVQFSKFLKRNKYINKFLSDENLQKSFFKYLVIGFSTFSIEYTLYFIFLQMINIEYLIANLIVYVIAFCFNFFMNRIWSFKSKTNIKNQISKYAVLFVFNLIAITLIIYFLTEIIGFHPLVSKVLVMGAVVSWNFILYKLIIFK